MSCNKMCLNVGQIATRHDELGRAQVTRKLVDVNIHWFCIYHNSFDFIWIWYIRSCDWFSCYRIVFCQGWIKYSHDVVVEWVSYVTCDVIYSRIHLLFEYGRFANLIWCLNVLNVRKKMVIAWKKNLKNAKLPKNLPVFWDFHDFDMS